MLQQLVDVPDPVVAQQILGDAKGSATVEEYAHVDETAMVAALTEVARRQRRIVLAVGPIVTRYAIPYSTDTLKVLRRLHVHHETTIAATTYT